jgi:Cyclic nucleotide-binding domain/HEAT repeats/TLC ATP/ADP transporter
MNGVLRLAPGESRVVGPAAAAAFVSAAGLTLAASTIDGLLFARDGVEDLPVLYLLLGGTMFLATLGVSVLLGRLGRGRAFLVIPVSIAVIAGGARLAVAADADWIYPALWLLRGASEFLLGFAVWGLAGLVTDTRQAKRFFPLIGGAAVLGQVVGGVVTRPLADWLGTDDLILVWLGTLVMVVVLGRIIVARASTDVGRPRRRTPAIAEMRDGLRVAVRSPLLRWMSVGSILFSLLFFSLYLPFSRAAAVRYPQSDDLAGFLGLFFAVSTSVTLLLSLLVMNRLLSRVGVPTVMMVLPVLYLLAFGVLTVASTFAILLAFRFAQVVWLQGGASSVWEAVINTVPGERRDRMRAFLYGGPTQVGTVLAGIVALIGERALSPRVLYGIGLAAAAAALYSMWRVRRAYASELVLALREGRPQVFGGTPGAGEPFGLVRADRAAVSTVIGAMADPDVGVRRVAAEILGDLDAPEAIPALVDGVRDDDPEVRATALRSLARSEAFAATDEIPDRLADPVPEVRLAALEALGALRADRSRARSLLADPDGLVRARAAGILLEDAPRDGPEAGPDDRGDAEAEAVLARLTRSPHAEARVAAFRALASSRSADAATLARRGLSDPARSVRTEAARTVLAVDPIGGMDELIAEIADGGGALEAAGAAMSAAPERAAEPVRRLAAMAATRALDARRLADSIETEGDERLELLRDSLLAASRTHALTAIRAVALLHGRGAIAVALESLSADDPAQRANALEVIETVGDHDLVRPLLAIWEPGRSQDRERGWRDLVSGHPDDWIRTCAAWATGSATTAATPTAEGRRGGDTEMTETLTTMPLVERVLFLRRVPLFTGLPPQDLVPIATIASEHSYADADTIAEQGEPGDEMHIIVTGYVMVILREPNGHRQVLAVRSAGDVIGEMAVITSGPRMASLAARGPVRLLSIERRQFEAMLRERPETSLALLRVLCQRLVDREATIFGVGG